MLHEYGVTQKRLTALYALSLLAAIMMAVRSLAGILYPSNVYLTDELYQSFVPNDVVNIAIGLPVLMISMWLARRGRLSGLLLWPGALFYILYNYIVYVLAMPLSSAFIVDLVLVIMCTYGLIALVSMIDRRAAQSRLQGRVSERLSGGVLTGLGLLILAQAIAALLTALSIETPITNVELALHVTDSLIAPAWIMGGIALWRRSEAGYVVGLALLFQGSMLFVGLIVFLLLQPILTGVALMPVDIVVVAVMGLICFVPFVRFLRGIDSATSTFVIDTTKSARV